MNFLRKHFLLTGVMFLTGVVSMQAQLKINTFTYTHNEDKITESQRKTIESATVKLLEDYYNYADFLDESTGNVTAGSMRKFKNLFQSSSRVLNDLTTGVNSHYSDYASSVLDFLPKGVKFEMPLASISDMDYDEAGYFTVEVQSEKTVYTGLNYSNQEEYCKTGREYRLKFLIIVEEDNLTDAKISKISGSVVRRCEDAKPFVGFGIRGAADVLGTSGFTNSTFLDTEMNGLNAKMGTIWNVGAGLNFQLPITKKELLFLNVGANYSVFGVSTDISETYMIENAVIEGAKVTGNGFNGEDWVLNKSVSIEEGKEEITVHAVEFPVGVRYRKPFKGMQEISFVADVAFVTTLQLFSNSTLGVRSTAYELLMDTDLMSDDPAFFVRLPDDADLENFGAGVAQNDGGKITKEPEIKNNLSFGIRVSPGIQYELNDNVFLEATLEYSMGLTSFFTEENIVASTQTDSQAPPPPVTKTEMEENYFLPDAGSLPGIGNLEKELGSSFIERYLEDTQISTLGLRVGIVYMFD